VRRPKSQSDTSPSAPSGDERTATVEAARSFVAREIDLGLEVLPAPAKTPLHGERAAGGRRHLPRTEAAPPAPAGPATVDGAPVRDRPVVRDLPELLVEADVRGATSLDELKDVLGECERCKLYKARTNIVFGVGNPEAELMFVGEGPGEEEDRQGLPFVGRAGGLLTDIITKGMGLQRRDVYIANVIKCRPPNNRNPQPDEIVACEPFLHRQIAIIRPRVIVTLGTFATQCLLKNRTPISKQRGRWHDYQGVPVMPTFHPAYLLRNPSDKRTVWQDIKLVMERLDLPLPARTR
jgi:uracil-DNA glycosylase family 4